LARGMRMTVEHTTAGPIEVVGPAVKFDPAPPETEKSLPPPALGEHTEWVLRNCLGYSTEKMNTLAKDRPVFEDSTVALSSCFLCGVLFFVELYRLKGDVNKASQYVAMFHHVVSMVLAAGVIIINWDSFWTMASFGHNTDYPLVNVLQHFNIGYFTYDLAHVVTWDRKFLGHHIVAIAGFLLSDVANVFGLANAMNTFITELGSIMYNYYNTRRSTLTYTIFVVAYSISRLFFLFWSTCILWQAAHPPAGSEYPAWAPYAMVILQSSLFVINCKFLLTHVRKLYRILTGQKAAPRPLKETAKIGEEEQPRREMEEESLSSSFYHLSWFSPGNSSLDGKKPPTEPARMFTDDPTGVVTSFFLCGSVFMFYLYQNGSVRKSCDLASMFHHVTAMVIALGVIITNWNELVTTNASYA
ncbi:hypothetical protein FOZ63_020500, partial [Perkinsus olseni]